MKDLKNKFKYSPISFKLSIIAIIILILAATLADFYPQNGIDTDILNSLQKPSSAHLFGTDDLGRDYFARALHGARASLSVGIISVIVSTIIAGIQNIIIIIGLFNWMGIARLMRAETLSIKQREYVSYAKMIGINDKKIMLKHIFRNVLPTLSVAVSINVAGAILTESALSFLGLGVRQPASSWGSMLKDAQQYLGDYSYLAFFPGLLILITVLSFNVIGDYLREEY